jgi:hypothetical protein
VQFTFSIYIYILQRLEKFWHSLENERTPRCFLLSAVPLDFEIRKGDARWEGDHLCYEASLAGTPFNQGVLIGGYYHLKVIFMYFNSIP